MFTSLLETRGYTLDLCFNTSNDIIQSNNNNIC